MQQTKINPSEIQWIENQLASLSENWDREKLDRKGEIDQLRMELVALRTALALIFPEFDAIYRKAYSEQIQQYDPEADRPLSPTSAA